MFQWRGTIFFTCKANETAARWCNLVQMQFLCSPNMCQKFEMRSRYKIQDDSFESSIALAEFTKLKWNLYCEKIHSFLFWTGSLCARCYFRSVQYTRFKRWRIRFLLRSCSPAISTHIPTKSKLQTF